MERRIRDKVGAYATPTGFIPKYGDLAELFKKELATGYSKEDYELQFMTRVPELLDKLHILFNAGIGPATMDGFYRGARITFQSHGLLAPFQINTLNLAWHKLRALSPWTGKRFDPIDDKRLLELTQGYEKKEIPTFFGSNTVVFHTSGEKLIKRVRR